MPDIASFSENFIQGLIKFNKATELYFPYANKLANYLTRDLMTSVDWEAIFNKDKEKFLLENDFISIPDLPELTEKAIYIRKKASSVKPQLKEDTLWIKASSSGHGGEQLLQRLTDKEVRQMSFAASNLYEEAISISDSLKREIDVVLREIRPSPSEGFLNRDLQLIGQLLNTSQWGNPKAGLTRRSNLIRNSSYGGLAGIILNDHLRSLQNQCKKIKDSALDLHESMLWCLALCEPSQSRSRFEELNLLNDEPKLKNNNRIFLFKKSFEKDFRKTKAKPGELYFNAVTRLRELKILPVWDLIRTGEGKASRYHRLRESNVWKMDVLKKKWQISFTMAGEEFTFLRLTDHKTMDRLYG